jgi:hypothetical protein
MQISASKVESWTRWAMFKTAKLHGRKFFNLVGVRGFVALRKYKSRGYCIQKSALTKQVHLGRLTVGVGKYNFA